MAAAIAPTVNATPRIAYGSVAKTGNYPYTVFFKNDREFCSGSIIAPEWVLTAAHCVVDRTGQLAPLAEWNVSVSYGSVNKSKVKEIPIKAAFKHPKYAHKLPYPNDIALIKLSSSVSSSIKPSKLPASNSKLVTGSLLTAVGWGMTQNGSYSNQLKFAPGLKVLSLTDCMKVFKAGLDVLLPPGKFCVSADPKTHSTTCAGDSGGPYLDKNGVQVGVNSLGVSSSPGVIDDCGSTKAEYKSPTKVSSYLKWIKETMAANP